jgi:hypothetical protein
MMKIPKRFLRESGGLEPMSQAVLQRFVQDALTQLEAERREPTAYIEHSSGPLGDDGT